MKSLIKNTFAVAMLGGIFALGCSSTGGGDDGGDAAEPVTDAGTDTGPTLFGLSTGDTCFDVVSIATGSNDGCDIGVAGAAPNGPVGGALPVNYVMATATLTVGTAGSLGAGPIAFNMGTLTRANDPTDATMPTCGWHQTDTSQVTLTATNEFDISVTEVQSMFKTACAAATVPTGGTCTSTWTWHMKKSTTATPPCN